MLVPDERRRFEGVPGPVPSGRGFGRSGFEARPLLALEGIGRGFAEDRAGRGPGAGIAGGVLRRRDGGAGAAAAFVWGRSFSCWKSRSKPVAMTVT